MNEGGQVGKMWRSGPALALLAATLFGGSVPVAKRLLGGIDPWLLAGLLYLGSGIGLGMWWLVHGRRERRLKRADLIPLAGAVTCGGVLAPVLLMMGLRQTPASTSSLLLNLEGVFTAGLAWFVFRENFDRRIFAGMALITAGGMLLSTSERPSLAGLAGPLAIAGACLGWGIDNNLTRKVAAIKGLVGGVVNSLLALVLGAHLPDWSLAASAALLGLAGYGVSLVLFILALRNLGTARTGAYFSTAPFIGAMLALALLHEPVTLSLGVAGLLMAVGVWLHLTVRHEHVHSHEAVEHEHMHYHDEHHQHPHAPTDSASEPHSHPHRHELLVHSHPHYPDTHHRHRHERGKE